MKTETYEISTNNTDTALLIGQYLKHVENYNVQRNIDRFSLSRGLIFDNHFHASDNDNIVITINKDYTSWSCNSSTPVQIHFTNFQQFLNWWVPEDVQIELNENYTAIVSGDVVEVGCQTFTHDKVKELYNAILKFEKPHEEN
jgi:hypothetical protein